MLLILINALDKYLHNTHTTNFSFSKYISGSFYWEEGRGKQLLHQKDLREIIRTHTHNVCT